MSARNISFRSHFSSSSSGEGFSCTIKKTLVSTRNLTNLKRILPQLNHLTLQCSSTSWYALSISLSKARNCLCCSRACDKETQYFRYCFNIRRVYITILFILAPYRIFVYSNLFVLKGPRMNWIILSQFFRFHSEPVVSVVGRTTTDISDIEIVQ